MSHSNVPMGETCARRLPLDQGKPNAQNTHFQLFSGKRMWPPPADAPLLSLEEAAAYLRMTPGAFRKLLEGRPDGSDGEMGDRLRSWLVALSPRRRYIRREPFMSWLNSMAGLNPGSGE